MENVILEIIINKNINRIELIAQKFATNSVVDLQDYISVGIKALIIAFNTFDKVRNKNWQKYSYVCIRNAILQESCRFFGPITISSRAVNYKITQKDIAKKLGVPAYSKEKIDQIDKITRKILNDVPVKNRQSCINLDKLNFLSKIEKEIIERLIQNKPLKYLAKKFKVSSQTITRYKYQAFNKISERFSFEDFIL